MEKQPQTERVVGVFPDEDTAEKAAAAAQAAGAGEVQVGDPQDEVTALQSEMQEEAAEVKPGFFKPAMARSVPAWTVIGVIVGVAVALAAAFTTAESVSLGTRLLVAIAFGAAVGGTIGFFFGTMVVGGLGRRSKADSPLEAEQGVVVGATRSTGRGPSDAR